MTNKIYLFFLRLGLLNPAKVMYVGGSDVLPPPLKATEEQELLARLAAGDHSARQCLIEHNLRLVVYIARRFEKYGGESGGSGVHRYHRTDQSHRYLPGR